MLTFRKATIHDLPRIMEICDEARRFMRSTGNLTQWVNGYPSEQVILSDIEAGNSYVGINDSGVIEVTFAFILGDDPTYKEISGGAWLNNNPYGTIHRMASAGLRNGMLDRVTRFCLTLTDNIRLDTHLDNKPMLRAASRLGYRRCGVITCQDGTPREAFHLINKEI